MASAPWVKYDDGTSDGFSANCFPVRSLVRHPEDVSGAWLFEQKAEQRRRFKAVLCTKPKTYAQIKEERKRSDREGTSFNPAEIPNLDEDEEEQQEAPALDGFFLMRHCCVEDPSDLCSVNIAGKELSEYKEEDFALFDNVAYVNASENYLPFEAFRGFPIIRELEIPLNGLRSIRLSPGDYPTLEIVDISYNNLSHEDILSLGTLPNLKVLHLTGNNFRSLPPDMALPFQDSTSKRKIARFRNLEILMLDDNKLCYVALFAALAGLRRLRHLNLEKNEIFYVPQLKSVEGSMVVSEDDTGEKRKKSGKRTSRTPRSNRHNRRKSDHTSETLPTVLSEPGVPVNTEASIPVPANSEVISNSNDNPDTEVKVDIEEKDVKKEPEIDLNEEFEDFSKSLADLDIDTDLPTELETEFLADGSKNPIVDKFGQEPKGPPLPPFPELRYLNLSYNLIAEEEALLSIAAWPMLSELLIANNPLTTEKSGDPPLLKRFLQDRLGIQLVRKKETETGKPTIEVPARKSRKVSNRVPKIPKISVEEKLMLEAPPRPPSVPKPSHMKALPPIPSTNNKNGHHSKSGENNIPSTPVYQRAFSEQSEEVPSSPVYKRQFSEQSEKSEDLPNAAAYKRQFSEESGGIPDSAAYRRAHSETPQSIPGESEYKRRVSEESGGIPESSNYRRAHSVTPQNIPGESDYKRQFSPHEQTIPSSSDYKRPYSAGANPQQKELDDKPESKSAWSDAQPDQAFFMTQVDETEEAKPAKPKPKKEKVKQGKSKPKLDDKYKGYEILLDFEEDPHFMDPKDMQGNVKALKFALGHELVYRDAAARLDRIEKSVEPYKKWEMPPKVPRKTRGERVDDVLTKLKHRETVDEANLSNVLKDTRSKRKQFPEAQTLLAEIQKRYNTVRVNSMKEAREVKKVMTGTAHDLSKKAEILKAT
ncbi:X-ray radiation resistance-associated protein 1 [Mytilus coruscus]|uniref:X-ray radiation resistance-associated protein 1 n=1 Tax=Mytilus coruscus TaxID=42192 RepID=A0A6J8AQM2_MYTCO|nr:X-ray radiation resistance-associated protein 1 [Mytilus coruscus]